MSAKTISLIIDIFIVLFIILGVMWGMIRGLKKSSIRLAFIVPSIIIAMLTSYSVAGLLLDIKIPLLENSQTINEYVTSMIKSAQPLNFDLAAMSGTIDVMLALAKMVIASVIFIIIFFAFKMITWIIYFIVTKKRRLTKAEKEQRTIDNEDVKKHRLLGGLVGAVQGLLIGAVLLVPIAGFSGVIADINNTVDADTGSSSSIIQEYVPSDIIPYLSVYEDSFFHKALGWINLDRNIFQAITTQKVGGVKVSLTTELKSINTLYQKAEKYNIINLIQDSDYENALNTLSDDETKSLIDDIFDWVGESSISKFVLVDASNYFADSLNVEQELTVKDIQWNKETVTMAGSLSNILLPLKNPVANSMGEDKDFSSIDFENVDFAMVGRGINGIKKLQLTEKIFVPAVDFAIEKFGIYEMVDDIGINLRNINIATADWEIEFKAIGQGLILVQKLNNIENINDLSDLKISEILDIIVLSNLAEEYDAFITELIEEQTGIDLPEDFSILDNPVIIESIGSMADVLVNIESGETISQDDATTLLTAISNLVNDETGTINSINETAFNLAGIEIAEGDNIPDVYDVIDVAGLINAFVTADDDVNLGTKTLAMVDALDEEPYLIQLYSFRNNKYAISETKMTALASKTSNDGILAMFIVI